ncbi:putative helix-turn-helix domain of transposase IS66 [Leptospira weilii serovar Topaz str. LT2116]|uniref:Putative helix-turn-helix domain of transposase IS66 n=1 Tax=Leptospira weilii serovar Topaz str. LT2116 TaxID=1088540 RepID=M3GUT1_9LEPT|nr:putative helix-turn-helix domain of transposase IS66 [Leptospira weilii serovar Topaz str. LT2116]
MLHDIPESEKICSCGQELTRIGEEKSEKLDIIPAKIQVEVHVRPKNRSQNYLLKKLKQ